MNFLDTRTMHKIDMRAANLFNYDLSDCAFQASDLRESILAGANLRNTNFTNTNLLKVNLGMSISFKTDVRNSVQYPLNSLSTDNKYKVHNFRNTVSIVDMELKETVRQVVLKQYIAISKLSHNKKFLVLATNTFHVLTWSFESEKLVYNSKFHKNAILAIDICPNDQYTASGGKDTNVYISIDKKFKVQVGRGHWNWVNCLAFTSYQDQLVSGSTDRTIIVWSVPFLESLHHINTKNSITHLKQSSGLLASVSQDFSIEIWKDYTLKAKLCQMNSEIKHLELAENILSVSLRSTTFEWNLEYVHCKENQNDSGISCSTHANSQILTGYRNGKVDLQDLKGQLLCEIQADSLIVDAVAVSPTNNLIAAGTRDFTITLWRTTGEFFQVFQGHSNRITCILFTEDSQCLISGSKDRSIKVWNLGILSLEKEMIEERGIASLNIAGDLIVSAFRTSYIHVWDLQHEHKRIFKGKTKQEFIFARLSKSKSLLIGICNSCIFFWATENENLILKIVTFDVNISNVVSDHHSDYIAFVLNKQRIYLFSFQNWTLESIYSRKIAIDIRTMALSCAKEYIVVGDDDSNLICWDISDNYFEDVIFLNF